LAVGNGLWEGFAKGGRDFLWGVSEQVAATGIEDKIKEVLLWGKSSLS